MNDVNGLAVQVQAERVREIKSITFILIRLSRLAADDNPFDRTHRLSEIPLVGISRLWLSFAQPSNIANLNTHIQ